MPTKRARPQSDGPYRERGADRRGNLGEFSKIQSNWARRNDRLMEWPMPMDIAELVFLAVIGLVALVLIATA